MNILCKNPLIKYYDNFITDEECEFIINASKDNMKRADVSDKSIDINTYTGRTNKSHWIPLDKYELLKNLAIRISKIIGLNDYKKFESFQVIYYTKGQEYKYHYDAYDKNDKEKYEQYCQKGNRLATVLCYLNNVTKGGGTGFDSIEGRSEPLIIEPVKGRMVVFQNVHADGSLHHESRHAGLPVEDGEKWAFNLWVREKE
tara:strand:+ start:253 stop:855 length:603 start_codon:yes stop_codon:yes gene_type:complete